MIIEETILKEIIKITFNKSLKFLSKFTDKQDTDQSFIKVQLENGLSIHINKALKFSENISIFRSPDNYDIAKNSIPLCLAKQDRRFSSIDSKEIIDEVDLLYDDSHHLLLGDPGAGKTTTLKRLTKRIFNILFCEKNNEYKYSFPIVVRLGEIDQTETLLTHICGQLGLEYQTHEKTINFTETKEEHYIEKKKIYHEINDNETGEKIKSDKVAKVIEIPRTKQIEIQRTETTYEYKIGKYPLKYSLSEYLNKIECILFVDGLDEIHHLIKDSVFEDIKGLSQILKSSKIILTSRYIQEIPSFKQFKISEILPLNEEQKHEIADIWISNPRVFFLKIHKLPYKDLTNRPLFLFYLLRLFENNNEELPKQAVDVYRQIVLLSIREWDDDKELQIRRYSKYKSFDTYKKEDFLSEIAFELT